MISETLKSDLLAVGFVIGLFIIAYRIVVPTDEYFRQLDIERDFEIAEQNKQKRKIRPRSTQLRNGYMTNGDKK